MSTELSCDAENLKLDDSQCESAKKKKKKKKKQKKKQDGDNTCNAIILQSTPETKTKS